MLFKEESIPTWKKRRQAALQRDTGMVIIPLDLGGVQGDRGRGKCHRKRDRLQAHGLSHANVLVSHNGSVGQHEPRAQLEQRLDRKSVV